MSGSVNKVIIIGNLGRDPEVRHTQGGAMIVSLTVATSEVWNDRTSGERREKTEWHRIVIFNERLGEVAERFLRKGRKVYLEGSLQTRKWTDQQGQERYTTEIVLTRFDGDLVMIDSNRGGDDENRYGPDERPSRNPAPQRPSSGGSPGADLDDEVPFGPCFH